MLKILEYPHPLLKKAARKIRPGAVKDLDKLVADMFETMHEAPGVGLAAPQIGKSIRLFIAVLGLDDERVFINPQVLDRDGFEIAEEGCLSFPGLYGMVERPTWIRVKYFDEKFLEHTEEFSEWAARVILHENDHLDGILISDRTEELYEPEREEEDSPAPEGGKPPRETETGGGEEERIEAR